MDKSFRKPKRFKRMVSVSLTLLMLFSLISSLDHVASASATTPTSPNIGGKITLPTMPDHKMGNEKKENITIKTPSYLNMGDVIYSDSGDLEFTVTSTAPREVSIKGNGFFGELTIPSTVKDEHGNVYAVTAIEEDGFVGRGANGLSGELEIPDSITSIGANAFCLNYEFSGTLRIPASAETISDSAFADCSGFELLEFHLTDLSRVEPTAFEGFLSSPVRCPGGYKEIYEAYGFTDVAEGSKEFSTTFKVVNNIDGTDSTDYGCRFLMIE